MSARKEVSPSVHQPELPFSPPSPVPDIALTTHPTPVFDRQSAPDELFPNREEPEPVTIDQLTVVAPPEVNVTHRTRNGRVIESKEWRCRVQYQAPPRSTPAYQLLVLHATTQCEAIKKLRVQLGDTLRVSGMLSAAPQPLRNGSELHVHHLYVSDLTVTKRRPKSKPPHRPVPPRLF